MRPCVRSVAYSSSFAMAMHSRTTAVRAAASHISWCMLRSHTPNPTANRSLQVARLHLPFLVILAPSLSCKLHGVDYARVEMLHSR